MKDASRMMGRHRDRPQQTEGHPQNNDNAINLFQQRNKDDESPDHLLMEEIHAEVLDNYHRSSQAILTDSAADPADTVGHVNPSVHHCSTVESVVGVDVSSEHKGDGCANHLSETPDTVSGEFERALQQQEETPRTLPRTNSMDRRLDQAAQFFQAVGEHNIELHHIIEDDNDDSDEDMKTTEIRLPTLCGHGRLRCQDEVTREAFTPHAMNGANSPNNSSGGNGSTRVLRRPLWPFFRRSKESDPFLHRLPGEAPNVDFIYRGIRSNPPEITQRGISRGNYSQLHRKAWLEVSDRKHRYGKNLRLYYRHWESLDFPTRNFFDWLDSEGEAEGQPRPELEECARSILDQDTVLYIADFEETKGYALSIECDSRGRGRVLDVDGNRVCTGPDGWIFVLRDQVLYGAEKIASVVGQYKQRFHHSSFFGGKAVAAAGIIITDDEGFLVRVFPHSGHYRPGEADMQRMLFFLHSEGIDLRTFDVDTQQLCLINRQDQNNTKKKKTESLHLKRAVSVANHLSHKARMIGDSGEGVFSQIHKLQNLDDETKRSVSLSLDFIDSGGYWKNCVLCYENQN